MVKDLKAHQSRYVIGDIHGCLKTLEALIAKLEPGVPITFVGDLIDRGPHDAKVVDFIRLGGFDCVMGNHEHMLVDVATGGYAYGGGVWLRNGGKGLKAFSQEQIAWMSSLPYYLRYDDLRDSAGLALLVCHGGVHSWHQSEFSLKELDGMPADAFMWNRQPPTKIEESYQVCGHTPLQSPIVEKHWAFIDTGCVYSYLHEVDATTLTALRFPEMTITQQVCID